MISCTEPAERLREIFLRHDARFVNFVEAAEFERIDELATDDCIGLVKRQIRQLHEEGFETGLHLHPQWYNAVFEQGKWLLDSAEYNLCELPAPRITQIVDRSLAYLRHVVGSASFTPLSFRAGNWLFQPTRAAARVLASTGIRIDSSVFKGGLQRSRGLDYRRSLNNADYWRFASDVNAPDPSGALIELPIYVAMVPFWQMLTRKRTSFGRRRRAVAQRPAQGSPIEGVSGRLRRLGDFVRLRYPLKLDFCRMTLRELCGMLEHVVSEDRDDPDTLRPVVAIGHTKDLLDPDTVEKFLTYLKTKQIAVVTFADLYPRLCEGLPKTPASGRPSEQERLHAMGRDGES